MNGSAFFRGQVGSGETVHMVGNLAVVTGVGTLHHQVGGNDAACPCVGHRGGNLVPCGAVGLGNGAGLKGLQNIDFHFFVGNGFAQIAQSGGDGIRGIQPHIGNDTGLRRDNISGRAAFHHGKGSGGAHQCVDLTAAKIAVQIQHGFETPQIGKENLQTKAGMTTKGIEHFRCRLGQVHLEGVVLNPKNGRSQRIHGGIGRGRGSVTTAGKGLVLHIHHALFRDANEGAGRFHTGEHILHHGAAFVYHQRRLNAMLGKEIDDVHRTLAVDLFTAGEGEENIMFGAEALGNQVIGGAENTVHGDFGIQCAATPHDTVFNDGLEGRLVPLAFVHGHHIIVGHQHGGIPVDLAGPAHQQCTIRQGLHGADIEYSGVQIVKAGNQLFEFCVVFQRRIHIGDGFTSDQRGQRLNSGILIKGDILVDQRRLGFGGESGGADKDHG